jgi:peptidoglycan/LPS O-acetylase OafA/YrhL
VPAAIVGLGPPTTEATLVTAWYVGLTVVALAFAYRDRGVTRRVGVLIIGAYAIFAASVIVPPSRPGIPIGLAAVAAAGFAVIGLAGARVTRRRAARAAARPPG